MHILGTNSIKMEYLLNMYFIIILLFMYIGFVKMNNNKCNIYHKII